MKKKTIELLPGGLVEVGEDSKIGVEHERLEELGLEVNGTRLIALIENFFVHHETGSQRHFYEIPMYYQWDRSFMVLRVIR